MNPDLACEMLARTKQLGKRNLALKYGEAKKRLWQSERTGDHRASIDSDVDAPRLNHEGTRHLPLAAGVNRGCLKFAGTYIGEPSKVSGALKKSVQCRSKLETQAEFTF